ncbi:MAG: nucleotide exchange factor GrpE [Woeseiaceae bacterium]|nr:nucleotide exchange factor GrpE [Woeseiaceae bacterium]
MSGQAEREDERTEGSEGPDTGREDAAGEASITPPGDPQDLEQQLVEARAAAEKNWDLYLRAAAELENVRKRASRDVENARRYALERFAKELLQVCDSLEMGLATGEDADAGTLLEGSRATRKQLAGVLEQFGVEEVDPAGEPFDPALHEAMTMQPSADAEPGSVLTVFQKGYTLNGRLLRPARVVVAESPAESAGDGEKSRG